MIEINYGLRIKNYGFVGKIRDEAFKVLQELLREYLPHKSVILNS